MKSKELRRYNLTNYSPARMTIDAKPYTLLIVIIFLGFVIDFVGHSRYGLVNVVFGLMVLVILPQRVLIEFYDEYMVLYNKANKLDCYVVYYDEVDSWEYKTSISLDRLIIRMCDGSYQSIEAYSKTRFESCLNRYMKDKRIKSKREQEKDNRKA